VGRRRGKSGALDSDGETSERSLNEADYVLCEPPFSFRAVELTASSKSHSFEQFEDAPRDGADDEPADRAHEQLDLSAAEVWHAFDLQCQYFY
jgi:hypothetical protein